MNQTKWHSQDIGDVFAKLGSSRDGLSEKKASERIKIAGPNKIELKRKEKSWLIFIRQFKSPLVFILVLAGFVTIILESYLDAAAIFGVVFINSVIGFFQERRALKTLRSLQESQQFFTWALRDGNWQKIRTEDVVPGDVVRLRPGDKVPADARIIHSNDLLVSEAVLTGEFLPVPKKIGKSALQSPLGDRSNMVFKGTSISDGKAEALVVETGKKTEFGKIGQFLENIEETRTPFEQKIKKLGRFLTISIVIFAALLVVIGMFSGQTLSEMFLISVAVIVSAIPEGLPIAVTVILAIGMTRILSKRGLVKKLSATEALGSTSVILTDKTGTLTTGLMEVDETFLCTRKRGLFEISPPKDSADTEFLFEIVATNTESIVENNEENEGDIKIHGRPTDKAMLKAALEAGISKETLKPKYEAIKEVPFNSDRKFSASFIRDSKGELALFFVGAPEVLLKSATKVRLDDRPYVMRPDEKIDIRNTVSKLAKDGLRVIAVGYKSLKDKEEEFLNYDNKDLSREVLQDGVFVGLITLKDPVRKDVLKTIQQTKKAGIRTVMVTGDHALTARAVGQEIGLTRNAEYAFNIMEGSEVESLQTEELAHQVRSVDIFARVTPENKLKIVKAWQSHGEVVAVTGDGVNDAPALKMADVGIAVGSGTDISKEVADIILLDNSFPTIVSAVREGRVIVDNLKKVIAYLLSDSLTEVVLIAIALLVGLPVPVLPAQILWINLIEGSFPSIALAFDPAEKDTMKVSPLRRKAPLMDKKSRTLVGVVGTTSVLFALLVYLFFLSGPSGIDHTRTMVFSALATNSLFFAFSMRSLRKPIWKINFFGNKHLLAAVATSFLLLFAAVYLPPLQTLLRTSPLSGLEWIILGGFGILNVVVIETTKWFFIKRSEKNKKV